MPEKTVQEIEKEMWKVVDAAFKVALKDLAKLGWKEGAFVKSLGTGVVYRLTDVEWSKGYNEVNVELLGGKHIGRWDLIGSPCDFEIVDKED